MKSIIKFITEGLKVTGKSKVNNQSNLRDVSGANIGDVSKYIWFKSPSEEAGHYNKMDMYFKKGSKPERLANSIKDQKKLMIRWYIAVTMGWLECAVTFRQHIIDRGYADEDQLDNYVLTRYKKLNGFNKTREKMEEYFTELNVKYD